MALIKNANVDKPIETSGYYRLTGDKKIAKLLRDSHSTVITNGTELEKYLEKYCPFPIYKTEWTYISPKTGRVVKTKSKVPNTTPTLSDVFEKYDNRENCFFPKIKISREELKSHGVDLKNKKNIELDGVWIHNNTIYITEIKDGSNFDTKKVDGEIIMFKKIKPIFDGLNYQINIVLWNIENIDDNELGSLESDEYAINGLDFSKIVGLPFDKINEDRSQDQKENVQYLINQMREVINEYETNN
jgi:hypothetical protein